MSSYLITGASRGIGLELVKQLSRLPTSQIALIIAVTRDDKSTQLQSTIQDSDGRFVNVIMESLVDEVAVQKAVPSIEEHLNGKILDVLINNAGWGPFSPGTHMGTVKSSQLLEAFNVNVISAHNVTSTLLPLLERGQRRTVINVSTTMGSLGLAAIFAKRAVHSYEISKTAMNALTVRYAVDYEDEGFTFAAISPGWVKTDLGSQYADLELEVAGPAIWC